MINNHNLFNKKIISERLKLVSKTEKLLLILVFQLFFSINLYSQFINEEYLIENLKQLSSSEFKGRKPTQETFRTVQDFLVTKYKENGLTDITNNYEQ